VYRLFRAGANDIVREMFDSSLRAGRYVLENVGLSEYEAHEAEKAFYKHDRHAMRQLAPLWDPDKPVYENEAYVARAKELEQELESTMLSTRTGEALDDEGAAEDKEAEG
jgi:CPA2 family monovalent cation:H+ antiporter-2